MGRNSEKGEYESPEGSYTWEYLSCFCCTLLILCVGTAVGWNSPVLGKLMVPDSPIPLGASEASTMAALGASGNMLGPPLTMLIVDRLGRKMSLLLIGLPVVISWVLVFVAKQAVVLYVSRFLAGVSLGLAYCICPMYIGEISSPKLRGGSGMFFGIMFNTGVLVMMAIVPYVSIQMSAGIAGMIAVTYVIGMSFMPESPYYLTMVGKTEKAEIALAKLRGKTDVSEEMELIKLTLRQRGKATLDEVNKAPTEKPIEKKKASPLRQLCTVSGNRKALAITMLFSVSHHLGGFITLMVYGQIVFTAMKAPIEAHLCTIIVSVLQFVSTIAASFFIDRLGRKPLIFVSGAVSCVCLLIISGYFYFMEYAKLDVTAHVMIPLIASFVFAVAANCGLMPVQNVVLSEIFDAEIKTVASCAFGIFGGLLSTCTVKIYLLVATTWGYGQTVPFLTFAVVTLACTSCLMWLLPETKGKTFLQIQRDLNA